MDGLVESFIELMLLTGIRKAVSEYPPHCPLEGTYTPWLHNHYHLVPPLCLFNEGKVVCARLTLNMFASH